jgi:hypothetical protein
MKKNLFAFIFICYGLFSAIGFSEAQSPIDTSPTAITSNPWSPPENGGAGWYPQISSNGRYVAYATANINSDPTISNHIWVNDLQTNTARDITPAGVGGCYSPHWISESRVTFFCDNGSNGSNSIRFEASAPDFSSTATTDSPNLVGGNAFSASGGNWASWGFNRLTWNNQIIRNNTGGNLDVSGNRLIISCTNQNNSICLYQSGRPAGTFTPQTRIYGMSINSGYIVYGGRGPVRGITPGGNDVNLTASQFEEGNGEVVTVNGAPWVVTTAYDRANDQGYILFRPWGMRDSIILRAPANNIAVAYDAASNSFIVAYNTDRGSLTTLRVDANSPRRDISGGIPPESGLDPNAVGFASSSFIPVPTTEMDFGQLIQFIINYSFYVVGIAIFGVMFWAGFTWFTAAGNSSKINEAKGKIYNAIIGAILLSSAYVLLYTINPDLVGGTFTLEPIAQPERRYCRFAEYSR